MAKRLYISLLCLLCLLLPCVSARKGHMAPLGQSGTVTPLPFEHKGFPSPAQFLNDHVLKNKPLLMRGAALDMPALQLWSDAYMMEKTAPLHEQIQYEKGKKETRSAGGTMTFSEYLRTYNDSDIYYVNSVPPSLTGDMIIPWPLQCAEYERSLEDNVMWFSSGGTKSVIHHDGYENINCLLRGRKRFLFVNTTKYQDIEPLIIDKKEGSYGTVDVEKVDLDKYPFYEGMEFFAVDMNAGDCVYSPALWIHQVESWGSNLAVNVWWFTEINDLVNLNNCSPQYNMSKTFRTVAFHKTTEISDGKDPDIIIHALRHGIARMVFKTTGLKALNNKQFIKTLTNGKILTASHKHDLLILFSILDANKNKKLEVSDLRRKLSESRSEKLLQLGTTWMSTARVHDYPLPVDFSSDSYKTIRPFSWSEVAADRTEDDSPTTSDKKNIPEFQDSEPNREEGPVFDPETITYLGDHDML